MLSRHSARYGSTLYAGTTTLRLGGLTPRSSVAATRGRPRHPGKRLALLQPVQQQPGAETARPGGPLVVVGRRVTDRGDVQVRPRQAAGEVLQEQRCDDGTRSAGCVVGVCDRRL